jgi:hypothetical protein
VSRPLLGLCVPTRNRASDIARLLGCLDVELVSAPDAFVLISDNASDDGTWALLQDAVTTRPWLQIHRQEADLGLAGNMGWLVEHAPPCEYLWCFGDDDLLLPGGLSTIVSALRAAEPAWLWLPYVGVDADHAEELVRSPAPGKMEVFADGAALWTAYHHWLTFITASIVRREAFQEAVGAIDFAANAYAPLLWYFRAGHRGPCAVVGEHVLTASQEISWADRAHIIQTLDFTRLWEDGLGDGMSAETFGASLNSLYVDGWARTLWERHPIEELMRVVTLFPQARGLREYLWTQAVEQRRQDPLAVLAVAAEATGDGDRARALVAEGQTAFGIGDGPTALRRFTTAADVDPTCVDAWNDAAVVLHAAGDPTAARLVNTALFVAPGDADARANAAEILRAGSAGYPPDGNV